MKLFKHETRNFSNFSNQEPETQNFSTPNQLNT